MSLRTLLGAVLLVVGLGGAVASSHMFFWPIVGEEGYTPMRTAVILTLEKPAIVVGEETIATVLIAPNKANTYYVILGVSESGKPVGVKGPMRLEGQGAWATFRMGATDPGRYMIRVVVVRTSLPATSHAVPLEVRSGDITKPPSTQEGEDWLLVPAVKTLEKESF